MIRKEMSTGWESIPHWEFLLQADHETDEVYAQMTLLPIQNSVSRPDYAVIVF